MGKTTISLPRVGTELPFQLGALRQINGLWLPAATDLIAPAMKLTLPTAGQATACWEVSTMRRKQRKGPKPGSLARYAAGDRALFPLIEQIMRAETKSITEAVRQLDDEGRVQGRGASQSRVTRVVKLFKKEREPFSMRLRS